MRLDRSSKVVGLLLGFLFLLVTERTFAWEDHTFLTHLLFSQDERFIQEPLIRAETLESFLEKEKQGLVALLAAEEEWAKTYVQNYPARPAELVFQSSCPSLSLKTCFLHALRVNPHLKLNLFLQVLPGDSVVKRPLLPMHEVTLLSQPFKSADEIFIQLREGESVKALDVLASASDEPDYGIDVGLWEDNQTEFGKNYRFGKQPFGNPVLEYSGQAPFHMGFFHESEWAYRVAGYLSRTYPEYRVHLFKTLSLFAFEKGHPYWGYRFAGWALHYVQDLTQPYHSTAVPGVSFLKTVFLGFLDLLGIHAPLRNQVQLLTNEHLALENFQYFAFLDALKSRDLNRPYVRALFSGTHSPSHGSTQDFDLRTRVSLDSFLRARLTHQELRSALPERYIQDPHYIFGTTEKEVNLWRDLKEKGLGQDLEKMNHLLGELMEGTGIYSRAFIHSILEKSKSQLKSKSKSKSR